MKRAIFVFILLVIIALTALLVVRHVGAATPVAATTPVAGEIIWQAPCPGGTWIVIEDEVNYSWSVWCAKFHWDTRELTWIRGRSCEPHYSTKVVILENIFGTPKAVCRYKY